MTHGDRGQYSYCKTAGCQVSLEQTEGQCRDEHHCGDEKCPLEGKFHGRTFAHALNLLAPGIRLAWEEEAK